jgi:acyl transferase domain-containing protein
MPPDETSLVSWAPTPCLSANDAAAEPDTAAAATLPPKLILLSSADKSGIGRIAESLQTWYTATLGSRTLEDGNCLLDDLAYTLDSHRSQLPWQSFALLESSESLKSLATQMSTPARVSAETPPRLGFVFSGQGAQWFAMGRELLCYSSFKDEIREGGRFLADLGCPWSPLGMYSSVPAISWE